MSQSLHWLQWDAPNSPPKTATSSPRLIHPSLDRPNSPLKRHPDPISRFATVHFPDTDRQTGRWDRRQSISRALTLYYTDSERRAENEPPRIPSKTTDVLLTLRYFSYALPQRDIHAMASSCCSWCSCIRLPAKCVTWHLCSRCSIVCGCWPQWLQVGVFLFPHLCRVCVVLQWPLLSWFSKTRSPRDSADVLNGYSCSCTKTC